MAPSLKQIERSNRQSSYPLTINSDKSRDISELRAETAAMLGAMTFPPGYGFDPPFDPDSQADKSAMRNLIIRMSILLVFLIMGALFESFLLPLAILTTIPMAALGAYWALFVTELRWIALQPLALSFSSVL